MAGASGGLWSIEGGNKLVCTGLLYASKAQLISGPVISIEAKTRPKARAGVVASYLIIYFTFEKYEIRLSSVKVV